MPGRSKAGKATPKGSTPVATASNATVGEGLKVISGGAPAGFYVYGLLDAADRVFYVGKGSGKRWLAHYRESIGPGNQAKRDEIRVAKVRRCAIFAEGLTEGDAFDMEARLIATLPNLTNLVPGQRSEIERSKAECREMLANMFSETYEEWSKRVRPTSVQVEWYHRILAELHKGAEHGIVHTSTWRSVNGEPFSRVA